MLSVKAEAMALTYKTIIVATVKLPTEISRTHSAMAWIRPFSSAAEITMKSPIKNTRSCSKTSR
jgi:hypothetical protein